MDLPRDDSDYVALAASADGGMICTGGQLYTHLLDPRAGEVVHRVSGRRPPRPPAALPGSAAPQPQRPPPAPA
jgi:hypothetical protein